MRNLLQEELLVASLLEKQLRFKEAEDKYRKLVADAGLWAEPRNAFGWFLIERGEVIEPAKGNLVAAATPARALAKTIDFSSQ